MFTAGGPFLNLPILECLDPGNESGCDIPSEGSMLGIVICRQGVDRTIGDLFS